MNQPIGVFDSGYGGLSVLRELRRRLPHEDYLYLGDSGRAPYGGRDLETVLDFAVLFGLQLVIAGIFRFDAAFAIDEAPGGARVLMALLGVLSFIIGLYALRHINVTIVALALLFGIFWSVHGSIELFTALSQRDLPERGWIAVLGLLSILVGVIVLVWPAISLTTLAILLGIWLLILGAMEILLAFRLRSVGEVASRIAAAT